MLDQPMQQSAENSERQRLSALVNNMSDGVAELNEQLIITLTNAPFLSLIDKNTVQGMPISEVLSLRDKSGVPIDIAAKIKSLNSPYMVRDWKLEYSDGSSINVFVNISPVKQAYGAEPGSGYLLMIRDITRERMLDEEREEFVSVAGHELRTPITIAEGSLSNSIILAERNNVNRDIIQNLKTAHDQITFLSSLVNDLSMLSRADRGQLAATIEKINIKHLLDSLHRAYNPQISAKGLKFEILMEENTPDLNSSALYVKEILQNFITNSLKYTATGSIGIQAEPAEAGVRFKIWDTGFGISKKDQTKLFGKFFRSEDERVRKARGTGLGLYITLKLIKLLGAKLEYQSELNKGTIFSVTFPNLKASK